jgi:hypothetical protein
MTEIREDPYSSFDENLFVKTLLHKFWMTYVIGSQHM